MSDCQTVMQSWQAEHAAEFSRPAIARSQLLFRGGQFHGKRWSDEPWMIEICMNEGNFRVDLMKPDFTGIPFRFFAMALRERRFYNLEDLNMEFDYSVAAHCVNCALVAREHKFPLEAIRSCFAHDFAEAIMRDIPRPVRWLHPSLNGTEDRILHAIWKRFDLSPECLWNAPCVKWVDEYMLAVEASTFFNLEVNAATPEQQAILSKSASLFKNSLKGHQHIASLMFMNLGSSLGFR